MSAPSAHKPGSQRSIVICSLVSLVRQKFVLTETAKLAPQIVRDFAPFSMCLLPRTARKPHRITSNLRSPALRVIRAT